MSASTAPLRGVAGGREAGEESQRTLARLRALADTAPTVLWIANAESETTFLSRSWSEETGQPQEAGLGTGWLDAVHPEDRDAFLRTWLAAVRDRVPYTIDFRARRRDGTHRWASSSGRPHFDENGTWIGYVGNVVDIHERVLQTQQLERLAEFRRSTMALVEESLSATDPSQFYDRILARAVDVIPGAQAGALLVREPDARFAYAAANGYDLDGLRGIRFSDEAAGFGVGRTDRQPRILVRPRTHACVPDPERMTLEMVGLSESIESVLVVPIVVDDDLQAYLTLDSFEDERAFGDEALEMARVFAGHVGTLIKRFALEEDLQRLAYQDVLTSVPNRARLMEHLHDVLARASDSGASVALLFVDVDDLKPINDSLGHRAGDEALRIVAARLSRCAPAGAMLARLGGDEFTFVLAGREAAQDARRLADRVLVALEEPFRLGGHEAHLGASMGISVYPDDAGDGDDLLRRADIAMYHAKQRGKHAVAAFEPEMEAAPLERLLLEEALRAALEKDEFVLHYQPCVDVATGRIRSFEALVRWVHPQRGTIPPSLFVPLAETTNLIHALGRRIFEMAARQARAWRDAGFEDVRVAVNVSARQLERADLVDEIREILAAERLPASALEIEVLESVAMKDVAASAAKLAHLKELGVTIALDDFGTGYSSLAYLQELSLDVLKVDRSFLKGEPGRPVSERNQGILRAILGLGATFGLEVVAEGVEDEGQWRHLRAIGCHQAQGYLLSRPVPAHEVRDLLRRASLAPETVPA